MQFLTQSQTAHPLIFGPIISNAGTSGPSTSALQGLAYNYITTLTSSSNGSTTSIVDTGNTAIKGQLVYGLSGTTGNIGEISYVTVTGSTLTISPAFTSSTATSDTFALCGAVNAATSNGTTTTFVSTSATGLVVGMQIIFTTGTSGNIGESAWITIVNGSTYTFAPAVTSSTASLDTIINSDLTVFLSKDGGAWNVPVSVLSEVGPVNSGKGYYQLNGNATDTNTLGKLLLHWDIQDTTSGISNEVEFNIIGANVYDAIHLGLSAIPNASPGGNAGLPTVNASNYVAGVSSIVSGNVVQFNAQSVILDANNLLEVDVQDIGGYAVTLDSHNCLEVDVQDWNGTPVPALTSVVIGQATTVITTDTVANGVALLPGQYSLVSGTVIVGGYSIGQDPWTIVSGGVVDNSVPSGIVYVGPFLEMLLADRMGPYGVTYIAGQLEAKYYKQNGTTKVIDATTLINGSNQSTSRTTILSP